MIQTKSKPLNVKSEAAKIIKALSKDASWDDLAYQIHVRQKIAQGMSDINAGHTHSHQSIKKTFSLSP